MIGAVPSIRAYEANLTADNLYRGRGAFKFHRLFKQWKYQPFHQVNLVGVQSNSRGIGARVTVTSTTGMSFRQNNGGGAGVYASQSSELLHFGIGSSTQATVEVKWPSGIVDTLSSVAADSTLRLVEGTARYGKAGNL